MTTDTFLRDHKRLLCLLHGLGFEVRANEYHIMAHLPNWGVSIQVHRFHLHRGGRPYWIARMFHRARTYGSEQAVIDVLAKIFHLPK